MTTGASPERQSTARRLTTYAAIVVGLGLTAYAVGERLPGHSHSSASATDNHSHGAGHGDSHGATVVLLGAAATSNGYTLVERSRDGASAAFVLEDDAGSTVADYDLVHGAELHVVMVTPDLASFEHVHPEIDGDGMWLVTAPDDREWHVVFESTPSGASAPAIVTSHFDGTDEARAADVSGNSTSARVGTKAGNELTVELRATATGLRFTVTTAEGNPVEGMEAYLEQPAHLVVFRIDDLAYAHLHPTSGIGEPEIAYDATLPAGGAYRLFLQFALDGEVLTVPFTYVT